MTWCFTLKYKSSQKSTWQKLTTSVARQVASLLKNCKFLSPLPWNKCIEDTPTPILHRHLKTVGFDHLQGCCGHKSGRGSAGWLWWGTVVQLSVGTALVKPGWILQVLTLHPTVLSLVSRWLPQWAAHMCPQRDNVEATQPFNHYSQKWDALLSPTSTPGKLVTHHVKSRDAQRPSWELSERW